jgi:hypothetical protein
MPSKRRGWSRSWNPLRKHAETLPSVEGVNHVSILSIPHSPSRSAVTLSDSRPVTPSTTLSFKEDAQVALNGLHELLKVLKESAGLFAPLKAAVGSLLSCIEIYQVCCLTELMMRTHIPIYYQRTSGNQKEMDELMKNIDRLSSTLARGLPSCQESFTRQGINGLAKYVSEFRLEV